MTSDDFIEISGGLDADDLSTVAEALDVDLATVTATAKANITQLQEAAHYAALDSLRSILFHQAND